MEKIVKRRIRQNKAYRHKKEGDAHSEEWRISDSISISLPLSVFEWKEDLEQANLFSFVSRSGEEDSNSPSVQSLENVVKDALDEDECLHLKHLWETEEQWFEVCQVSR